MDYTYTEVIANNTFFTGEFVGMCNGLFMKGDEELTCLSIGKSWRIPKPTGYAFLNVVPVDVRIFVKPADSIAKAMTAGDDTPF